MGMGIDDEPGNLGRFGYIGPKYWAKLNAAPFTHPPWIPMGSRFSTSFQVAPETETSQG